MVTAVLRLLVAVEEVARTGLAPSHTEFLWNSGRCANCLRVRSLHAVCQPDSMRVRHVLERTIGRGIVSADTKYG